MLIDPTPLPFTGFLNSSSRFPAVQYHTNCTVLDALSLLGGGFCLHLRIWPADVHANRCAHAYRVLPSGYDLPRGGNGYYGYCTHVVATRSGARVRPFLHGAFCLQHHPHVFGWCGGLWPLYHAL